MIRTTICICQHCGAAELGAFYFKNFTCRDCKDRFETERLERIKLAIRDFAKWEASN